MSVIIAAYLRVFINLVFLSIHLIIRIIYFFLYFRLHSWLKLFVRFFGSFEFREWIYISHFVLCLQLLFDFGSLSFLLIHIHPGYFLMFNPLEFFKSFALIFLFIWEIACKLFICTHPSFFCRLHTLILLLCHFTFCINLSILSLTDC